jgi:hypothetical protein
LILTEEQADLPTPFGTMRTYVFRPAAPGRYPGVVLFSEIFQVTGPIRRTAAMLAGHGYLVAVPEVFHESRDQPGVVLPYDEAGAERGNAAAMAKFLRVNPGLDPATGELTGANYRLPAEADLPEVAQSVSNILSEGHSLTVAVEMSDDPRKTIDRHYGHLARDSEQAIRARLDARAERSGDVVATVPD